MRVRGFDGCAIVGVDPSLGENVGTGRQIARPRALVSMRRSKALDDLRAAAMAMHIAKAADVHQDVKAQRSSRMKSAQSLVVPASALQS